MLQMLLTCVVRAAVTVRGAVHMRTETVAAAWARVRIRSDEKASASS